MLAALSATVENIDAHELSDNATMATKAAFLIFFIILNFKIDTAKIHIENKKQADKSLRFDREIPIIQIQSNIVDREVFYLL